MDRSIKKFTKAEEEILEFLFTNPTTSFRGRTLAERLRGSASGVIKSARNLEKRGLLLVSKDFTLSIKLNRDNKEVFILKRINNLKFLYQSGLVSFLADKFPGAAITVFGSYSYGDDTEDSDIDVAIIGYSEFYKRINNEELKRFNITLEREIQLHFFENMKKIHKNLRENIINGIVLEGAIKL